MFNFVGLWFSLANFLRLPEGLNSSLVQIIFFRGKREGLKYGNTNLILSQMESRD